MSDNLRFHEGAYLRAKGDNELSAYFIVIGVDTGGYRLFDGSNGAITSTNTAAAHALLEPCTLWFNEAGECVATPTTGGAA